MNDKFERKKGSDRVVYVGKKNVYKRPYLQKKALLWSNLKTTLSQPQHFKKFLKTIKPSHLQGLEENWNEFIFRKKLFELTVPTKISLLGVINIQKKAEDVPENIDVTELILQAFQREDESFHWSDLAGVFGSHFLDTNSNFGVHDGKVKIRDYGERKVIEAVIKNREIITESLTEATKELQKNA